MDKIKWRSSWKASTSRRKQRKYSLNAPLHIKHKLLGCHLSGELRKKYKRRSIPVRSGDRVKVMRGQFRGKTGKVTDVSPRKCRVYVEGMEKVKKDGTKSLYPFHPSNLMITELNLDDKQRAEALGRSAEAI